MRSRRTRMVRPGSPGPASAAWAITRGSSSERGRARHFSGSRTDTSPLMIICCECAILAKYFRQLSDEDLRLAVRFAAGRTFAATDERVLSVGGAIVSDVILRLLRVDPQIYHDTIVASGEIGEALSKLWSDFAPAL